MTRRASRSRWTRFTAAGAWAIMLPACVETTTTQVNKPFFAGINSGGGFRTLQNAAKNGDTPIERPDPRVVSPDGTITLNSPTVSDLMRHILETIVNEEEELFTEQMLSKVTTQEFLDRGFDPVEAHREMVRRQKDIRALFQAMPAGEFTPGVLMENVGRNTFRLAIKGDPGLRWSFMDVVLEQGSYKLRWFGRQ